MLTQNRFSITIWRVIVVICSSYVAILIPLDIIFQLENLLLLDSMAWLVSLVFIVDVFINIHHFRELKKDQNFKEIYGKGTFFKLLIIVDIVAAIPFVLIPDSHILQLLPIIKLLRVYNIFYDTRQKHIQYSNIFTFAFFIFWVIHIIHWLCCGWCLIRDEGPNVSIISSYINGLYWTITTITTVGYGDILPQNNLQKLYSMLVMIMGFGVFGLLVGTIAGTILKKDPAKTKYLENIESLASFIHYRNIPCQLQKRIIDFYSYMWKKRLGYDESSFLGSLPENLRTEVALHIKEEVIEQVSLFKDGTDDFKRDIAIFLKPIFLTPGDYVFKAGDIGEAMFFIVSGKLNILNQNEESLITTLKPGDYFGEISLYKNINRTATVKAISYCDIYALEKDAFDHVISKYPDLAHKIKQIAEHRESKYAE
ncbi:cyclic nucleotide-binding domain-containing protein [Bacteroidota bacterium]